MRHLALIAVLLAGACSRAPELARLREENRHLKAEIEENNRRIEECRDRIVLLDRRIAGLQEELAYAEELYRNYWAVRDVEDR
jgi:uncharacterized protein YeeX (DUF496 family)